jgi:hypothetical protein
MAKWKKDPGSRPEPKKEGQDAKSQAFAICNAAQKAEGELETIMLSGVGPVLGGVAVTNRPFLPLPPISIVERDGSEYARVPILIAGRFKHPQYGKLVYTPEVFNRLIANEEAGYNHHGVSADARHMPKLGALAWLSKRFGGAGFEVEKDEDGRTLLVGYGPPAGEEAKRLFKDGLFRFASVEMWPDFKSSVEELLSTDDLQTLTLEELLSEEADMPNEYPSKNEDGTVILSAEQFVEYERVADLTKQVGELTQELETAQAKIEALEKPEPPDEMPEEFRQKLEERDEQVQSMQRRLLAAEVRAVIADAQSYRDETGRAHSPVLLEWATNVLQGKPVGDESEPIKLEGGGTEKYVFEAITWLLKHVPGQVPMDGVTEGDEHRLEGDGKYTKSDYQSFWGVSEEGEGE